MTMSPYLSFEGTCEEAFRFYEACLGARITGLHRYGGTPMGGEIPPEWANKVMHGSLQVGEQELLGADVTGDRYERPAGFSLALHFSDTPEAERVFDALAQGGRVLMPLAPTFWAARFGMLVDRFGIPWMINAEGAEQAAA